MNNDDFETVGRLLANVREMVAGLGRPGHDRPFVSLMLREDDGVTLQVLRLDPDQFPEFRHPRSPVRVSHIRDEDGSVVVVLACKRGELLDVLQTTLAYLLLRPEDREGLAS
ncbi:hypothetical protein SEA_REDWATTLEHOG_190 [Gordonia phage RedWattleHog]|uniref:Uncharacterized protein n=1 Tax=Gordonia phage Stormageddon TaxID=2656541 RepID=A0A649VS27_9CAUD|nr:hypothetical protein KHQ86_gp109 [Gordonia phage Stormageddon]QGJ95051.1 hypothetical protein SEA_STORMAGEDDON_191 [Gordonia phage Stormageddon]QLF83693.1 hypothetical protein SEA_REDWATTLEHOG_190 [Gordonia phage RedWattleHog]